MVVINGIQEGNMKYIYESIVQYLNLPKTNYALQIDGAWGIGKTYYLKNIVMSDVQKLKNSKGENWKMCYISLNGISTVDEIGEAVFVQIAGTTSQLAFQGMKLLGRYGGGISSLIPVPENLLEGVGERIASKIQSSKIDELNDIVLCFDDLERIDDKLSLKQIFGYINSNFIEHNNVKVIFISNENEIKDKDYSLIKEKVIGRTLKFTQSKNSIIKEISDSIYRDNESFMTFYDSEKDNIEMSINTLFKDLNLRTLRFILDTFIVLQEKALKVCKDEVERLETSKSLFLNVLIISKEYKEGKFNSIEQLEGMYNSTYLYTIRKEGTYENEFIKKYHHINSYIDNTIYYFKSVSKYILNGFIEHNFEKEINNYLQSKIRFRDAKKENPLIILSDFMMYEDEEVKNAQIEVIIKMSEDSYKILDYITIYNLFRLLNDRNLVFLEENPFDKIEECFNNALDKWVPNGRVDLWGHRFDESDPIVMGMVQKIKSKSSNTESETRIENVKLWLAALSNDTVKPEMAKAIEYEKNLFEIFIQLELDKNLHTYSNSFIYYLSSYINQSYLKISNAGEYFSKSEVEYTETFIESLNEILSGDSIQGLKKYNIECFRDLLMDVNKHLKGSSIKS